jgi:hypothetical protein
MKKTILVMVIASMGIAAMAAFATGVAYAQAPQPVTPGAGMGMGRGNGEGPLHEYMVAALAKTLGITPADFEARRAAGKTAYQIALDLGKPADQIPALITGARTQAIDAALAAKVITQQQADWMKSRGAGMGQGICDGTGQATARGMGRGGRWQQANP